jgi:two-component system, chemotaxis family, protein-glutamate methylesterase/glutaminase
MSMTLPRIKVLVVEDSAVVQLLLVQLLKRDPQFDVIGTANNGEEALTFVAHIKPDVILMDVHMPQMDGIEATRRIMETEPVPIVVASASLRSDEVSLTFRALEAGALAFVDKSARAGSPEFDESVKRLKQTLKLMSEVKVVRRRRPANLANVAAAKPTAIPLKGRGPAAKLVAIGVSTGGPPVLQRILSGLPKNFPLPLLIVQHITPGFLSGLTDWLCETTGLPSHVARHETVPKPGNAYFAPDDFHMGLDHAGRIVLSKAAPEHGLRPAVAYLFRSVTDVLGSQSVGVLLTGMGKDGAEELKQMKQSGAVTMAQDQESSIVHGMPGAAIALGAATYVLSPEGIAAALASLAQRK